MCRPLTLPGAVLCYMCRKERLAEGRHSCVSFCSFRRLASWNFTHLHSNASANPRYWHHDEHADRTCRSGLSVPTEQKLVLSFKDVGFIKRSTASGATGRHTFAFVCPFQLTLLDLQV